MGREKSRRTVRAARVELFVGDRPLESLGPEERKQLARHIYKVTQPALVAYAEIAERRASGGGR